jgi:predicted transcriptional regulator
MPKLRKKSTETAVDERKANAYVKALTHPVRVEVIRFIRSRGKASPSEIQEIWAAGLGLRMGEAPALSVIAYHVRMLVDYGVIKLVDTKPRRGAVEHYYGVDDEFDLYLGETRKLLESL